MSLLHSVNSAATFLDQDVYFLVDYPDGSFRAWETLAVDDPGYPFMLTTLVGLGAIQLNPDVVELVTRENYHLYGLFDPRHPNSGSVQRRYDPAIEDLVTAIWRVPFYVYFLVVSLISIVLLTLYSSWGPVRVILANIFLLQLPLVAPSLFFDRLHSHSLIVSSVMCGVLAALLILSGYRRSLPFTAVLNILAGFLLGIGDQMRHAEGLILIVAILMGSIFLERTWPRKFFIVFVLIASFGLVGLLSDALRYERNQQVEISGASTQQSNHPFGHVGLMGVRQSDNALGVKNMDEIAKAVAEHAGKDLKMGQPEYHLAAQRLFLEYVRTNPMEYFTILIAKVGPIAQYAAFRMLPESLKTDVKKVIAGGLWMIFLLFLAVGIIWGGFEVRWFSCVLVLVSAGCLAPPILTGAYYSFGLTVLLFLVLLAGTLWMLGFSPARRHE